MGGLHFFLPSHFTILLITAPAQQHPKQDQVSDLQGTQVTAGPRSWEQARQWYLRVCFEGGGRGPKKNRPPPPLLASPPGFPTAARISHPAHMVSGARTRAHVVPLATPGAATSYLQHWLLSIPPRQRAGRTLYPSLGALGSEGVSEGPGPGEFHQPQERLQESCSTDSHLTFLFICKVGAALLPSPFQKADSSSHLLTRDKCHPQLLK